MSTKVNNRYMGGQIWAKTGQHSYWMPPKRAAHPSRVRRGCFDPPSPKIEAVGGANPHPPQKILNPRKFFFTQVCRNFKIFQFFYIFTNFIINEKCWNLGLIFRHFELVISIAYETLFILNEKKNVDEFLQKVWTCFRHYAPKLVLSLRSFLL